MKLIDVVLDPVGTTVTYKFDDNTEQTMSLTIPIDAALFDVDQQAGIVTMLFALIHDLQGQIDHAHTRINHLVEAIA